MHSLQTALRVRRLTVAQCCFALALPSLLPLLLSGCGKPELEKTTAERLKNAYKELDKQEVAEVAAARKPADYLEDVKAQLNRSPANADAAEKSNTTPVPVAGANAAPTAAVVAAPVSAFAVAVELPKLKAEPTLNPTLASPALVAPTAATPAPAPAPTPAPTQTLAARAPSLAPTENNAAPVSAATTAVIGTVALSKREPEFPVEARQRGVESGVVRARATVNSAGEVTKVEIISANPVRIFDRSVIAALRRWTFNTGADGRVYEGEFNFRNNG